MGREDDFSRVRYSKRKTSNTRLRPLLRRGRLMAQVRQTMPLKTLLKTIVITSLELQLEQETSSQERF